MAGIAEIVAGAVKGTADTGLSIWNAYQKYKNYQYQKDLQKQIFAREDNAIQRRVADAEAAGFNKFSVIGEGSNAGGAVSVSPPEIDSSLGSKVADALSTMYSLATQKAQMQTAQRQADIAFWIEKEKGLDYLKHSLNWTHDKLNMFQGFGLNPKAYFDSDLGEFRIKIDDRPVDYSSTPYGKMNSATYKNAESEMNLLEFQDEFKWLGPILQAIKAIK